MKVSILGAGTIGKKHASAALKAGASVGWIVDANLARARDLASQVDAQATDSIEEMLADRSINAVVIGIPNWLHQDVAIAALEAGKDVLLEKPMALNSQQCQSIAAAAETARCVLQIGFVHRFTGVGRAAKRLILEGRVGPIYHVRACLCLRRGVPGLGNWFTTKKLAGGGALIDVGVHLIDLSLFLLGFPEVARVSGQTYHNFARHLRGYRFEQMWGGPPNYEGVCDVEDAAQALIHFQEGSTLDLHVAWAGNYPEKLIPSSSMMVLGEKGGLAFELFGSEVHVTEEVDGKLADTAVPVDADEPFELQFANFRDAVRTRQVTGANATQGIMVQSIVDAVYDDSRSSTRRN